jgi:hypothetical protein
MLFTGAPIDHARSRMFYIVGVRRMPASRSSTRSGSNAAFWSLRTAIPPGFLKYIDEFPRAPALD